MASRDPNDSTLPALRRSPGEAVFQRLRDKEAPGPERAADEAAVIKPRPPRPPTPPTGAPESVMLETELQDQLKVLTAALAPEGPAPANPSSIFAPGAGPVKPATEPGTARRSAFAPDPVRQRTYYDLRNQTPDPEAARALPRREGDDPALRRRPVPERAAPVRRESQESKAHSRGLDARTLSVAALVGIGVGFAGLTLVGHLFPAGDAARFSLAGIVPMSAPAPVSSVTPEAVGEAAVAAVATKDQERVTAEVAQVPGDPIEGRSESGVFPAEPLRVVEAVEPDAAVAAAPPAVSPAPEVAVEFDNGGGLLSYAPVEPPPSFPPDRTNADGSARSGGPGTARVTTSVNMRAGPDNDASVVAVLAAGTVVQIESCDFWCTVVAGDKRGYVYRKFVGR